MKTIDLVTQFLKEYEELLFKVSDLEESDLDDAFSPLRQYLSDALTELSIERNDILIMKLDEQTKIDEANLELDSSIPEEPPSNDEANQVKIVEEFNNAASLLVDYKREDDLEEIFRLVDKVIQNNPSKSPVAVYLESFISTKGTNKGRMSGGEKVIEYVKSLEDAPNALLVLAKGLEVFVSENSHSKAMRALGEYYKQL